MLSENRHLGQLRGLLLRFVVGLLRCLELLGGVGAELLRVNLPELRMILDARVANGLGDCRIVNLAVPVPAVAEQIDDDIGSERVAVFKSEASDARHRVRIFGIHVEDGNRQALGEIGSEAAAGGLVRLGGESDQVVNDDMQRAAHVIARNGSVVEGFRGNALPRERGVAMHDDGNNSVDALIAEVILLGAGTA